MTEERDHQLGTALSELPTPTASGEFWVAVNTELDKSEPELLAKTPGDRAFEVLELPTKETDDQTSNRARFVWLAAAALLLVATILGAKALSTSDSTIEPIGELETHGETVPSETTVSTEPASSTTIVRTDPLNEVASEAFHLAVRNLTYPSEWSDTGQITLTDGVWTDGPADNPHTEVHIWLTSTDNLAPYAAVILSGEGRGTGVFSDLYYVEPETPGDYAPGDPLHVSQQVPIGRDISGQPQLTATSNQVAIEMATENGDSVLSTFFVQDGFLSPGPTDSNGQNSSESANSDRVPHVLERAQDLTYPSSRSRTGEIVLVDGVWLSQQKDSIGGVTMNGGQGSGSSYYDVTGFYFETPTGETFRDLYLLAELEDGSISVSEPVILPGIPIHSVSAVNRDSVVQIYSTKTGEIYYFKFFTLEGELVPVEPPSWMGEPELKSELLCWIIVEGDVKARFGAPSDLLLACQDGGPLSVVDVFPGAEQLARLGSFQVYRIP